MQTTTPALGQLLRTARHLSGLSQRELARRASLRPATVAAIETGESDPRWSTVTRLLEHAGCALQLVHRGSHPAGELPFEHARDRGGRHWPAHVDVFDAAGWQDTRVRDRKVGPPPSHRFRRSAAARATQRERDDAAPPSRAPVECAVVVRMRHGCPHVYLTERQKLLLGPNSELPVLLWIGQRRMAVTVRRLSWWAWGFPAPELACGRHLVRMDLDPARWELTIPPDLDAALAHAPSAGAAFDNAPLAFRAAAVRWLVAAVEPERRAQRRIRLVAGLTGDTPDGAAPG